MMMDEVHNSVTVLNAKEAIIMANKKYDRLKEVLMQDFGCSEEDIERYLNQNEEVDEELSALRKENEKLRKVIKKMAANADPVTRLFNAAASTSRRNPNLSDSEMRVFDAVMASLKQRPMARTHLRINGVDIDPDTYNELGRFMGAAANGFYYN